MASLPLTNDQRKHLLRLMDERPELLTVTGRQNLLENAGLMRFARDVDFNSNTTIFNQALVRRLQDFGTFNGEPALLPLVRTLLEMVEGREADVAFLNSLLVWNAPAPSPASPSSPPPVPGAPYVFLSYSSKDRPVVSKLAGDLEARGVRVWWDRHRDEGIKFGQNWERVIRAALEEVTHLAFCLTPRSVESHIAQAELQVASGLGKALLPVYLETLAPNTMPLQLVPLHYVDLRDASQYNQTVDALVHTLTGR